MHEQKLDIDQRNAALDEARVLIRACTVLRRVDWKMPKWIRYWLTTATRS
jgi:hypothetical protein